MIRNFFSLKYQSRKAYKRCGVRNLVKSIDEPVRSRRSADSDLLQIESLFSENINVEERQARAADTRVCLNLKLRNFIIIGFILTINLNFDNFILFCKLNLFLFLFFYTLKYFL